MVLIARMLGPEIQGEWNLYINAFTFGTIALGFGLPPAINHYLAAGKIDRKYLVTQLIFFAVLVGVIFLLILGLIHTSRLNEVFLPQIPQSRFVLYGLFAHLLLLILNQLMASILLAEKRFARSAQLSSFAAIGLLTSYLVFYFLNNYSGHQYFLSFIMVNIIVLFIQTILYLISVLKDDSYSLKIKLLDWQLIKLLFGFALLAYITNFLQFLNYKMDIWFINAYVEDETKLGIYGVAVSLAQLIWLVPNAFHTVIFTAVSENKDNNAQRNRILLWAKRVLLVSVILGILGYFVAIWLVPYLLGNSYSYILNIFPYLLPGIILFTPSILLSAYIAGKRRVDINFKASLLGFVLALVGNILFIPTYGVIGAACATTISYLFSSIYTYYKFNKLD